MTAAACLTCAVGVWLWVPAPETARRFQAVARTLPVFPAANDFVYGRGLRAYGPFPDAWTAGWNIAAGEIRSKDHRVQDLIRLTRHGDPKMRTLALAALFERQDPHLLPHMARMLKDGVKSFPIPDVVSARVLFGNRPPEPPRLGEQTVGELARLCVLMWVGHETHVRHFDDYWKARKGRKECAGWLLARVERARRGTSPLREGRKGHVAAVRLQTDRLPDGEREWTLLWLGSYYSHADYRPVRRQLVSYAELLQNARRLGRKQLLAYLKGEKVCPDPDIFTEHGRPFRPLVDYILQNAGELLRPEDVPFVLSLEKTFNTPYAAVAAAQLEPRRAHVHLGLAIKRFHEDYRSWDRARLAAELWRLAGEGEIGYLVNWFYGEKVDTRGSTQTEIFMRAVRDVRVPSARKLLAALITDKRLDNLDHASLRAIVILVNHYSNMPLVPYDQLYRVSIPPTDEDRARFADWRRLLRVWAAE